MPTFHVMSHALCPYVQRAIITLTEKQVPFERTYVDLGNKPEWFTRLSPLGKVPLLLVDETALFESAVICDYLDETIAPRLHPADPLERARHRAWIEFGSATLSMIARFYTAPDDATLAGRLQELRQQFRILETTLRDRPYFAGTHFSLVDATFGPIFRYFDVFEEIGDFDVCSTLPEVSTWRRALAERPSVRTAVVRDYRERLLQFLSTRNSALSGYIGAKAAQPPETEHVTYGAGADPSVRTAEELPAHRLR